MRRRIATALLTIALPLSAHAQLGGLIKKAAGKAAEAAVEKATNKAADKAGLNQTPPKYDDVIVELTPDKVDALLRGMQAAKAVIDNDGGGLAKLMKDREATEAKVSDANTRANSVSSGYYAAHSRWTSCESDVRHQLEPKHEDEARKAMANMIANPGAAGTAAVSKRIQEVQQNLAKAVAANDTAYLRKATYEYYKAFGVDLSNDDNVIKQKCGTLPTKPSAMVEYDRLRAMQDTLDIKIRAAESNAVLAGAKASGMSEQAFAMAKERAEMALTGSRTVFSKGELVALDARKADLAPFFAKK